jgi:anti-sigma factor RsiW
MLRELNKESTLLMYLADELSATDRAEVNRRLATDANLRAELERLEATVQSFAAGMAKLDAGALPREAVVVRRIGLAMRQHMVDESVAVEAPKAATGRRGLRYPAWVYPLVTAAAVLILFVGWWGHRPDGTVKLPSIGDPVAVAPMPEDEARQVATDMEKSFEDMNLTQPQKSVASLESAEYQLAELSRSRDGADFGFSDPANPHE